MSGIAQGCQLGYNFVGSVVRLLLGASTSWCVSPVWPSKHEHGRVACSLCWPLLGTTCLVYAQTYLPVLASLHSQLSLSDEPHSADASAAYMSILCGVIGTECGAMWNPKKRVLPPWWEDCAVWMRSSSEMTTPPPAWGVLDCRFAARLARQYYPFGMEAK